MSEKRKITVHDYRESGKLLSDAGKEVDAWCVEGAEGILAFFFYDRYLCIAAGDDGHWWMLYHMDNHWTKYLKRTVAEIKIPKNNSASSSTE